MVLKKHLRVGFAKFVWFLINGNYRIWWFVKKNYLGKGMGRFKEEKGYEILLTWTFLCFDWFKLVSNKLKMSEVYNDDDQQFLIRKTHWIMHVATSFHNCLYLAHDIEKFYQSAKPCASMQLLLVALVISLANARPQPVSSRRLGIR